jgi:hypothetical protein
VSLALLTASPPPPFPTCDCRHIFRICKALDWLPVDATREAAFRHLDARIPGPLKYNVRTFLVLNSTLSFSNPISDWVPLFLCSFTSYSSSMAGLARTAQHSA